MVSVRHWARRGARVLRKGFQKYGSDIAASFGTAYSNKFNYGYGSSTGTRTKSKSILVDKEGHSEVATKSLRSTLGHPFNKKCIGSAVLRYSELTQWFGTTSLGTQNVEVVCSGATVSQMLVGESETGAVAPSTQQGGLGLIDINPNRTMAGSQFFSTQFNPRDDQLFISNLMIVIDVTNLSSAGAIVDLYMVTPTSHTNLLPTQAWSLGLAQDAHGQGIAGAPAVNSVAAQVGVPLINSPLVTPETCNHFKKAYRTIGKYSFSLGGGATETIHWNVNMNYMIDVARITQAQNLTTAATITNGNITNGNMRHGTVHIMAVYRGTPALNPGVGSAGPPVVPAVPFAAYAPVKLAMLFQKKYTLKMVAGNSARLAVQSAGQFAPINTGSAKIIDADDDIDLVQIVT